MVSPPDDLMPVVGHPDYAISPAGEVWRLWRARPNARYPVPRRLTPVMLGSTRKTPHVRFDVCPGMENVATRSLAQLMREHFPDQPLQPKEA